LTKISGGRTSPLSFRSVRIAFEPPASPANVPLSSLFHIVFSLFLQVTPPPFRYGPHLFKSVRSIDSLFRFPSLSLSWPAQFIVIPFFLLFFPPFFQLAAITRIRVPWRHLQFYIQVLQVILLVAFFLYFCFPSFLISSPFL